MKTTDLMIGDWVYITEHPMKKEVKQVKPEHFLRSLVVFEPISLTPEILEKNGFIKRLFSSGKICGWYLEKDLAGEYYVIDVIYNNDRLYVEIHGSATIEKYCDYVHELQHALKLCGIDKEIGV